MIRNILLPVAALLALGSCTKIVTETEVVVRHNHIHAFVMMSFGCNDLDSYLKKNIREMEGGYIPAGGDEENLLFLYSQGVNADGTPEIPSLVRVCRNHVGDLVRANVMTFSEGDIPNTGENIAKVLSCIRDKYRADSYGLLLSSHGSGWVPPGYLALPERFEGTTTDVWSAGKAMRRGSRRANGPVPYLHREDDGPAVKSIGSTWTDKTHKNAYETDIIELAEAIPFKLDYIIFDACYMGGVEVAYELKDKCRWLCASQTEILGDGMDYSRLVGRLLKYDAPDPEAVCEDFYSLYENQSGQYKSATISMIDCSRLDALAAVCRSVFRSHDVNYDSCDKTSLQQFFRNRYRDKQKWFYDFRSVMVAAGATETELADIDWALEQCVAYRASTEWFMSDFQIKSFSGLSMYMPYPDRNYLNNYYKELSWNKATGLVK